MAALKMTGTYELAEALAALADPGSRPNWTRVIQMIACLAGVPYAEILVRTVDDTAWTSVALTGHEIGRDYKDRLLRADSTEDIGGLRIALAVGPVAARNRSEIHEFLDSTAGLLARLAAVPLRLSVLERNQRLRAALLDHMAPAIFLIDSNGGIEFANASAEALLKRGTWLIAPARQLRTARAAAMASLLQLFKSVARESTREAASLVLSGPEETVLVLCAVLAGPFAAKEFLRVKKRYVLLGFEIPLTPLPDPSIAELFKLTAAETRVFGAAALGLGVPEIARRLGLSQATIKTHLTRIFRKTGVACQSALVTLALEWSEPLLNRAERPRNGLSV